jgi:peptidoglycan/xylan/chitin deacetylase (PgdA/CDA1 family)
MTTRVVAAACAALLLAPPEAGAPPAERVIAVTIHDLPVTADGRLDPSRVRQLGQWLAAGHAPGNHTSAHRSAHRTPLREYVEGIERARGYRVATLGAELANLQ